MAGTREYHNRGAYRTSLAGRAAAAERHSSSARRSGGVRMERENGANRGARTEVRSSGRTAHSRSAQAQSTVYSRNMQAQSTIRSRSTQAQSTVHGRNTQAQSTGYSRNARTQSAVYSRNMYVQGTAAPAYETFPEMQEELHLRNREERNIRRRNREKAAHMNPGYVLFMVLLMTAMGFILIAYVKLQADLTNSVKNISRLESQLSELRTANDEAYNEIDSSISLDDIKYRAITELGMKYANEDQIVTYSNDAGDYVHQVSGTQ
ncbi:MAG: hypothetical protein Q4C60_00605 [Eubacteriales bacterium]|nr:hypothetical protein [Eubacteriales bacterium]